MSGKKSGKVMLVVMSFIGMKPLEYMETLDDFFHQFVYNKWRQCCTLYIF